jgi:hypothetical protein
MNFKLRIGGLQVTRPLEPARPIFSPGRLGISSFKNLLAISAVAELMRHEGKLEDGGGGPQLDRLGAKHLIGRPAPGRGAIDLGVVGDPHALVK